MSVVGNRSNISSFSCSVRVSEIFSSKTEAKNLKNGFSCKAQYFSICPDSLIILWFSLQFCLVTSSSKYTFPFTLYTYLTSTNYILPLKLKSNILCYRWDSELEMFFSLSEWEQKAGYSELWNCRWFKGGTGTDSLVSEP